MLEILVPLMYRPAMKARVPLHVIPPSLYPHLQLPCTLFAPIQPEPYTQTSPFPTLQVSESDLEPGFTGQ